MTNSHLQNLVDEIKRFEGFKDSVYKDSKGNLTCGWGHHLYLNSEITKQVAEEFLAMDIAEAISQFYKLKRLYNLRMNVVRCRVVVHMLFNMGLTSFVGFKKMLKALRRCDYDVAAAEMLDSRWHKQVGERAEYLADLMRRGEDTNL